MKAWVFFMEKIEEKIVNSLIKNNIIDNEQKELYMYCVGTVAEIGLFLIIVITSGILVNQKIPMILFLLYFFLSRGNAGGFHAGSYGTCFVLSVSAYVLALFIEASNYIQIPVMTGNLIFLMCSIGQYFLAPVDTPNKPIEDPKDIKKAKVVVALTALGFEFIYWIIWYLNIPGIKTIITCSIIVVLSQIIGKISNMCSKK